MRITQEEVKKFQDHFKGLNPGCPMCGATKWVIPDLADLDVDRTSTIPIITVFCENCAYGMVFAWRIVAASTEPPKLASKKSPVHDTLEAFAAEMEKDLGPDPSPADCISDKPKLEHLLKMLSIAVDDLHQFSLELTPSTVRSPPSASDKKQLVSKAACVANSAMFVADLICGGLKNAS